MKRAASSPMISSPEIASPNEFSENSPTQQKGSMKKLQKKMPDSVRKERKAHMKKMEDQNTGVAREVPVVSGRNRFNSLEAHV